MRLAFQIVKCRQTIYSPRNGTRQATSRRLVQDPERYAAHSRNERPNIRGEIFHCKARIFVFDKPRLKNLSGPIMETRENRIALLPLSQMDTRTVFAQRNEICREPPPGRLRLLAVAPFSKTRCCYGQKGSFPVHRQSSSRPILPCTPRSGCAGTPPNRHPSRQAFGMCP